MCRLLGLSASWKRYFPAGNVLFGSSTLWLNVKKVSWLRVCAAAVNGSVNSALATHAKAALRIDVIYPPPRHTHVLRLDKAEYFRSGEEQGPGQRHRASWGHF